MLLGRAPLVCGGHTDFVLMQAGVFTNLLAGIAGAKWGIKWTLLVGLTLQLGGLGMLFGWKDAWDKPTAIIYVTFAQMLCGVAKDLTKVGECKHGIAHTAPVHRCCTANTDQSSCTRTHTRTVGRKDCHKIGDARGTTELALQGHDVCMRIRPKPYRFAPLLRVSLSEDY
jgi:hypothetical protein